MAERPEVFEVQFTAGGFGWVVVHLDGIERDELAELTFEAWRLSARSGWSASGRPAPRLSGDLRSARMSYVLAATATVR